MEEFIFKGKIYKITSGSSIVDSCVIEIARNRTAGVFLTTDGKWHYALLENSGVAISKTIGLDEAKRLLKNYGGYEYMRKHFPRW